MITFLYSAIVRLSNYDTNEINTDLKNTYNPKGTANPTLVLGSVIINSILKRDKMVLYDGNSP